MTVRRAAVEDASALSALLADYLREKYPSHRGTSADELRRDVLSDTGGHRVLLVDGRGGPVGFVSWDPVYDMHWAARGAQVADLYVVPSARGLGIAIALLAGCVPRPALKVQLSCGADPMTEPLRRAGSMSVSRSGSISAECHCSGKAFRRLADLHGNPIRTIIRSLPPQEWNFQT